MYKTIDTLIPDMYNLLSGDTDHTPNGDYKSLFYKNVGRAIYRKLGSDGDYEPRLRMSNIGKPARQVWYDINKAPKEKLTGPTLNKFFYGDLIEEWAVFLAREAGHFVQDTQKEVEIDGVKGRMDCKIHMPLRSLRIIHLNMTMRLVTSINSVGMDRLKDKMKQPFLLLINRTGTSPY